MADGGSAPDAGSPPLISFVHAAPDVPAIRLCFGVTPTQAVAGTIPKPAVASGLPFGAGGALPIAAQNVALLTSVNLYVWAIPATAIASAPPDDGGPIDCNTAIQLPGSMLFAEIPKGTVQYGHSYLVAMDGCQNPSVDGGAAICGPVATDGGTVAFSSGSVLGNLRLEVIPVDEATVVPANAIGAQFVHLSPSLQALLPSGVVPALTAPGDAGGSDDAGDASPPAAYDYADITSAPVTYNGVYAGPPGSTLAYPSQAFTETTEATADLATAGIGLLTSSLTVPAPSLASISLGTVATATLGLLDGGPQPASALFSPGRSYTFVAIGDVGQTPATSATFFRIIALPSVH
jgi:hypothetical protein